VALVAATALGRANLRVGQFTSGVDLVEVYATVTDADGRVVTGLEAADFRVSEDGRPQMITAFSAGDFPLSVAVGLDRSFSMTPDRLSVAKAAARAFVEALRPGDRVMVVSIGSDTQTVAALSADRAGAREAIDRVDRWGTTPLYDATLAAIEAIRPGGGRRALLLLSDGDDRGSRISGLDLVERARQSDVLVYPVAIGRKPVPLFAELAAGTGGRSAVVRDSRQAAASAARIARELRFQYLLGYTPSTPRQTGPRWRSIQVDVTRSNARVRARDGYQAR
jgi:Ca-activated chloride channel homolog